MRCKGNDQIRLGPGDGDCYCHTEADAECERAMTKRFEAR